VAEEWTTILNNADDIYLNAKDFMTMSFTAKNLFSFLAYQ